MSAPVLSHSPFDFPSPSMAHALRFLAIDAVQEARSGHPGLPMGAADLATALFSRAMTFDAAAPQWPDRDRFVLSAGHGSMLLYGLLHLLGYPDMTLEEIKRFRTLGARTAGHPEYGHALGIETTTGPLGQGLANAVGMAMAERHLAARFGDDLVDHRTYVLVGDGCLMEGISQEALALAGHLALRKLIVLFDDNGISIDGPVSLADGTDQRLRFASSGWDTIAVDGHDQDAVAQALERARGALRPTFIACKTTIGYGSPNRGGTAGVHGAPLGEEEIALVRARLGWPHAPFDIPEEIARAWRKVGERGRACREAWEARLAQKPPSVRAAFLEAISGALPSGLDDALLDLQRAFLKAPKAVATRVASQEVLEVVNAVVPTTLGGSADLTGSNNTRSRGLSAITAEDFSGRYIHWGIREHAMAAAMNGMALHGGVIPYGGTFLVFSDYCRPAIRLSALMGQRVIYVMTHDSIGLGEDGPTHQPVEHLASLRAIPNLQVLRPCDRLETAQAWAIALRCEKTPSLLALSRQGLPQVAPLAGREEGVARGAYRLAGEGGEVVLFASGSEVALALGVLEGLEAQGIGARVVSVPCFELFFAQTVAYQKEVLGQEPLRVGIEAGIRQGWDTFLGTDGLFFGVEGFGASGPQEDVYQAFGLTVEAILEKLLAHREGRR